MSNKFLVFIPTYNERENVEQICHEILSLGLSLDILFMDDNSPDRTGDILDNLAANNSNVYVIHRQGKQGIGSAHTEGINYAYENAYDTLVTMDCDFTHLPSDIIRMVEASKDSDITFGSRYLQKNSLPGWNISRRFLTLWGHFLTKNLLGIPFDASGAFRVYNLKQIPRELFGLITSTGYSFFFESAMIFISNEYLINEVPIVLPARTYGHSKMTLHDIVRSVKLLLSLWIKRIANPAQFRLGRQITLKKDLCDPQNWDCYWKEKQDVSGFIYELIAGIYRRLFIRRNVANFLKKNFSKGVTLLHAGCGSGEIDVNLHDKFVVTAVDISPQALKLYSQNNPKAHKIEHASIFALPYADEFFDCTYNVGVMEHFTHDEIRQILKEFHRVLRPSGKVVIVWPHRWATSVFVLKIVHFVLKKVFRKKEALHPAEVSLLKNKAEAQNFFQESCFELVDYSFNIKDLFIQAIVMGKKYKDN
ncbi:MAG: glycosyltransferase [bacterium]